MFHLTSCLYALPLRWCINSEVVLFLVGSGKERAGEGRTPATLPTPHLVPFVGLITYLSQTLRVPWAFHFLCRMSPCVANIGEGFVWFRINESNDWGSIFFLVSRSHLTCKCAKQLTVRDWREMFNLLTFFTMWHQNLLTSCTDKKKITNCDNRVRVMWIQLQCAEGTKTVGCICIANSVAGHLIPRSPSTLEWVQLWCWY